MNSTISGTINHGDPHLLCTSPEWSDYILFYIGNYFAHSATIIVFPGQGLFETVASVVVAVIMPMSGATRGLTAILMHAGLERKSPLNRAVRACALCMVVKEDDLKQEPSVLSEQAPDSHQNIEQQSSSMGTIEPNNMTAGSPEQLAAEIRANTRWWYGSLIKIPSDRTVHGLCYLPKGYKLALVPPNTPMKFNTPNENGSPATLAKHGGKAWTTTLSSSYSFPKIAISLLQLLYSITTLYRARGNQIEKYGYAAFGLTVAPYAFMSLVNIIGNLLTPSYSSMFLVASDRLEEAINDGGSFDGVIGSIDLQKLVTSSVNMRSLPWIYSLPLYSWLMSLVPLAIVGGLSGFHSGNGTKAQRGWTMSWLVIGTVYGQWVGLLGGAYGYNYLFSILLALFMGTVPAIGTFVVVGQMLKNYGSCIRIN